MTTPAKKAIVRQGENRTILWNYYQWTAMAPTFDDRTAGKRSNVEEQKHTWRTYPEDNADKQKGPPK